MKSNVGNGGAQFNFGALTSLTWQVHVFAWQAPMQHAGFNRNAAYLIRPDGYIALAIERGNATMIADYFRDRLHS